MVGSVVALYFNFFVLVVQAFLKIPALHTLAPNGSEPSFAIAQGIVLVCFVLGDLLCETVLPCRRLKSGNSSSGVVFGRTPFIRWSFR